MDSVFQYFSDVIFDRAPLGMAIAHLDGTILEANPALCKLIGYTRDELVGQHFARFSPPGAATTSMEMLHRLATGELDHYQVEKVYMHQSGRLINARLHVVALPVPRDEAPLILAQVVDITDYIRAEAALRNSESKYRQLVEQSNDAIYLIYEGRFELVNQRFCDLFELTSTEIQTGSINLMDMVAPESKDIVLARRQQIERGDRPQNQFYEFIAQTQSGRRIPVETSVSYIEYRGGIAIQGIVRDISARRRVEHMVQERLLELNALVELFTTLRTATWVNEVVDIVLPRAVQVVNGVWSNLYLMEPETQELVSRGFYPPDPDLRHHRHRLGDGMTGYVAQTGQIYISHDLYSDPFIRITSEEESYLERTASSISLPLWAESEVVGVIHIASGEAHYFSDAEVRLLTAIAEMTGSALSRALLLENLEQRVAERTRALAEANEQLHELDRLKSKFVSDVSHELRTPVSNLRLYLDLLTRGHSEKRAEYLQVLRTQVERLAALTEDILDLSRLELRGAQVTFESVDLNEIVRQVVTAHLPRAQAAGLTLSFTLSPVPAIRAERNQIAQIVNNLLANAINYTAAGSITISTSHEPGNAYACLKIVDTGLGIDEADRPHLFERFYRGRHASQSNIPGTGLGLAIVKEVLDIHHGRLEIDSEPGAGSTFSVWLPLIGADDS